MIDIGEVVECRKVDGVDAHSCESDADTWDGPVKPGVLSEAEPKKTDWEEESVKAGKIETEFRILVRLNFYCLTIFSNFWLGGLGRRWRCGSVLGNMALMTACVAAEEVAETRGVFVLDDGEDGGEDRADHHGDKDEAAFLGIEAVGGGEYEGERGECHVEDGPGERHPEGEEEYDWFG